MGAANATKPHFEPVFLLQSQGSARFQWHGPCPTVHSLGDKEGIDWAFKIYTWNCPDASAKSKNETESSSVCPFTECHHRKTPYIDTLPLNLEQTTVIQM